MLLRNYACPLYNDFTCLNSLTRVLMFGKVNTGAGILNQKILFKEDVVMVNNDTDSVASKSQVGVVTKAFDDLIYTDDFIFCKTLENNQDLCKELAEMIIGRKISKVVQVADQKAIRVTPYKNLKKSYILFI